MKRGLALVALAMLGACTTPTGRIPEAERIWTCSVTRYLPGGTIEGSIRLNRAGQRLADFHMEWRGRVADHGWIGLRWHGPTVTAPPDEARASLSFLAGNPHRGTFRLELRRGAADGPAAIILPWGRVASDLPVRWGDVRAAGRGGGFFAVVVDRQGRIIGQSRVAAEMLAEPARAAAILREQLEPMVADHAQRCQLSPDREERITVT